MKLFQIEEPDGSPLDPDAPGIAFGIDLTDAQAEIAVSVGGNAAILADRDGFPLDLSVPPPSAPLQAWQELFEGARLRAERALAQPATHAVAALASAPDAAFSAQLSAAAEAAGLSLMRALGRAEIPPGEPPAFAAAALAEDLAPRPADR